MPLIILDRDGVINYDSDDYIKSPDEWNSIPGSLDAIAQLNRAGFQVVIATNQSGLARGLYDLEMLDRIHEKLMTELAMHGGYIEEIFFCPHHPDDACSCRKPGTGLLQKIEEKYPILLADTFFIGDSWVDMQAAQNAGCKPLLVRTGKGELTLQKYPLYASINNFPDLARAVDYVISRQNLNYD